MRRLAELIPETTLSRVRLGAVVLACLSLTGLTGEIDHAVAWSTAAHLALAGIAAAFVVTYLRGRTWVLDPIVLPALVAVVGSALRDPVATIGLTMVLLVVQSLYGSLRSWVVRSIFGMLSLPAALIAAPTPVGALVDVARSVQMVPQILLVAGLTRAIYAALVTQQLAAARDALLARTGNELLAATEVPAVFRIATRAAARLVELSPGTCFAILVRTPAGLEVKEAVGLAGTMCGRILPEAVLTEPGRVLADHAPRIRHWRAEEVRAGERYRLLGGVRPIAAPVLDGFRTLAGQVRLGEAKLRSHADLDHQANHDNLTQLPTRAKFFRELIAAVDGHEPGTVALFNIDLDDFKQINDVYGHQAGDELLVQVAQRIAATRGGTGLGGRLGGDEFVLLLTGLADAAEATQLAEDLCERLVEPMRLAAGTVRAGASIGVALTEPGLTAAELTRRADIAMYAAKARGKNRVELFTPDRHGDVARHRTLEDQLPHALERGEIHVHYQPYVDLRTGGWAGVEALVQWQHPTQGAVNCRELLQIAERTGDIGAVTTFFLRTVAEETGPLPGGDELRLGVNLSAHQLLDPRFADALLQTLAECRLAPSRVTLEIVETEQIDDPRARARLERLAACGVRIALDDFGTGYVSLASLRAFPIHQLKIDGSFLDADPGTLDLVLSVGALLGTETVVQGVSTEEQLIRLRGTRADAAQGPHLAPVMRAEELLSRFPGRPADGQTSQNAGMNSGGTSPL